MENTKKPETIEIAGAHIGNTTLDITFVTPDLHASVALMNTIHAMIYGVEEEVTEEETPEAPPTETPEAPKPRRGRPPKAKSTTTEAFVPENARGYVAPPAAPPAPEQLSIPATVAPPVVPPPPAIVPPPAPVAPPAPAAVDPHVTACLSMEKSSEVVKYLFDKVMTREVEGVKKDAVAFTVAWCLANAPQVKALSSKGERLRTVVEQQSASIWDQRHDE